MGVLLKITAPPMRVANSIGDGRNRFCNPVLGGFVSSWNDSLQVETLFPISAPLEIPVLQR